MKLVIEKKNRMKFLFPIINFINLPLICLILQYFDFLTKLYLINKIFQYFFNYNNGVTNFRIQMVFIFQFIENVYFTNPKKLKFLSSSLLRFTRTEEEEEEEGVGGARRFLSYFL